MAFGQGLHPHDAKHNHNLKMMALIGVGALAVFLFIRSRSSSTTATATDPTAGGTIDPTTGLPYGTPSTFADNGAQAAQLGDSVSAGLSGVQSSLDQLTASNAALAQAVGAGAVPATAAPTDPSAGIDPAALAGAIAGDLAAQQPAQAASGAAAPSASAPASASASASRPRVGSAAGPHGAKVAPYGSHRPANKPGYRTVGTGNGGWIYVPNRQTSPAGRGNPGRNSPNWVANHGSAQHQSGGGHHNAAAKPQPQHHHSGGAAPKPAKKRR